MSQSVNNQFSSLKQRPWNPTGDKTVLVSGCGISWSGQQQKTWVNLLALSGYKIFDVGGPAVSNEWIVNHAIDHLLTHAVDYVIIQLTSLGKLDVETDSKRFQQLVEPDSLRNFTVDGIWPSSGSVEHPSKQLWHEWLYSPGLELHDLKVKLHLLKFYCQQKQIPLLILSGYDIFKTVPGQFDDLVLNVDCALYTAYQNSSAYQQHDSACPAPVLSYQIEILQTVDRALDLGLNGLIDGLRRKI